MFSGRTIAQSASKVSSGTRGQACLSVLSPRLSQTVRLQHQTRNAGTAGEKGDVDMGGPGGQEVYPASSKKHRQYRTTAAIGTLTALGIMYMVMGKEEKPKSFPAA